MDDLDEDKFFLLIKNDKIVFALLNKDDEISFKKELLINMSYKNDNFELLNQFLKENLILFEKKIKHFVNEINLIVDTDEAMSISLSSLNSFICSHKFSDDSISQLLNLKNDVTKNLKNYDLVHMFINKYIINQKSYSVIPENYFNQNVFLEINFELIDKNLINNLKNILSKYQILVRNILSYQYVNLFSEQNVNDIFKLSNKLLNGHNQNEILFKKRKLKENGIFAKFFNLFN